CRRGAPPAGRFTTSPPQKPQPRTRTRTPPGGAVGEGSSRSAGDPPGVTVTASMSAQSLVAQPGFSGAGGGPAQRELGDGRARGFGEGARLDPEHSLRSACGGPDV